MYRLLFNPVDSTKDDVMSIEIDKDIKSLVVARTLAQNYLTSHKGKILIEEQTLDKEYVKGVEYYENIDSSDDFKYYKLKTL
jgi:hypothetical protein